MFLDPWIRFIGYVRFSSLTLVISECVTAAGLLSTSDAPLLHTSYHSICLHNNSSKRAKLNNVEFRHSRCM